MYTEAGPLGDGGLLLLGCAWIQDHGDNQITTQQ